METTKSGGTDWWSVCYQRGLPPLVCMQLDNLVDNKSTNVKYRARLQIIFEEKGLGLASTFMFL